MMSEARSNTCIGVERRRIDDDGVGRRRQRRGPTPAVARVAFPHVLQDIFVYSRRAALPATPRAGGAARTSGLAVTNSLTVALAGTRPMPMSRPSSTAPLAPRPAGAPRNRAGIRATRAHRRDWRRRPRTRRATASSRSRGSASSCRIDAAGRSLGGVPGRPDRRRCRARASAVAAIEACRCRDGRSRNARRGAAPACPCRTPPARRSRRRTAGTSTIASPAVAPPGMPIGIQPGTGRSCSAGLAIPGIAVAGRVRQRSAAPAAPPRPRPP